MKSDFALTFPENAKSLNLYSISAQSSLSKGFFFPLLSFTKRLWNCKQTSTNYLTSFNLLLKNVVCLTEPFVLTGCACLNTPSKYVCFYYFFFLAVLRPQCLYDVISWVPDNLYFALKPSGYDVYFKVSLLTLSIFLVPEKNMKFFLLIEELSKHAFLKKIKI